ncbi:MAG: AbrB/MazE/SpoVT family DNA-binding domain-containing protein [Solirubrobacteraceae bacterium]
MHVTIDHAGRIVVPKPVRSELGLTPGTQLEIDVIDDHIELHAAQAKPLVVDGPHGPVVAATGTPITAETIRATLEAARERR